MRKLVLALAGAAALAMGSNAANAAVVEYDGIDSATLNATWSESFDATLNDPWGTNFSVTFPFTLTFDSTANAFVGSIMLAGVDLDFTSILLDSFAFTQVSTDASGVEVWTLNPPVGLLAADNPHVITVNGTVAGANGGGSFGGNLNIVPVPEPGTWAMMLIGFAAVGYQIRKRRRPVLMQLA